VTDQALHQTAESKGSANAISQKKRYGCAMPPPNYQAPVSAPVDTDGDVVVCRAMKPRGSSAGAVSVERSRAVRQMEAELERLWRSKIGLHGVGYGMSSSLMGQHPPNGRRLYMSSDKAKHRGTKSSYGDFGTGVFDMDDYDAWENVYQAEDEPATYDLALKDDENEDETPLARLEDVRTTDRSKVLAEGELPGFTEATKEDTVTLDLTQWAPPPVPRGYRGMHASYGPASEEARCGSAEHGKLLEFLQKHGRDRLLNPGHRAELLGGRSREPVIVVPSENEVVVIDDTTSASSTAQPKDPLSRDATGPLWKGVTDAAKQTLLQNLGRNFVLGREQDMDGRSAKHEPFKSDPPKQLRYAQFCLALEGKASAAAALKDPGGRSKDEHEAELAEFGRVYRLFRQEHPESDLATALHVETTAMAPALRRSVQPWIPEKLLCKRWGVPEPAPRDPADLHSMKRQREYEEQVRAGLEKAKEAATAPPVPPAAPPSSAAIASAALPTAPVSREPPRPPESLFKAIFGDDDSDDDAIT